MALFRQYRNQLDPRERRVLGAAADTVSNTIAAADWLRDRSASLAVAPAPTGDAALDAVDVASASVVEPPPVTSWGGRLLQQDGVAGHRQRMTGIEDRRRALTTLNEQEFAGHPVRLRANQTAIETDTAWSRAAVKAEADKAYTDLQRHMTTGGPGGGPAVTLPPATILSRFTEEQQEAVAAQVNRTIEGKKTRTDPPTWYAIHQGLTGDDADERERWADTNLVQFRGELSDEDFATLTKLQTTVRTNDGGAEATRLQAITRMANRALQSAGIKPTPGPENDSTQPAAFHRALQDELSAFENSKGRKATAADTQDIVDRLATTVVKGGWLKASDQQAFLIEASDMPTIEQQTVTQKQADDTGIVQDETTERPLVRERPDADAPFTSEEIAQMRRTLAEGTAEQRAAVLAQYEALPEDMKDAVAEKLVSQTAEPSVMSDAEDEGLQDGQQYAAAPTRGGGSGRRPRALTPVEEMQRMAYQSKVDAIRLIEPQNRFAGPQIANEGRPISRQQMREVEEELVRVNARAAQRDLEREERARGETPPESRPSADDLVRGSVPGGVLSRSPTETPGRSDRGTPPDTPRSIVQTLQEREWAKVRKRHNLSENSPTNQRILENLDKPFIEFTGLHKVASIWGRLPKDMQSWTVRQVLESRNSAGRKLLMQERFDK
ncbi:hypothetical protein BH10PSE6_BH10PSE6_42160 [soil metagenome]